MSILTPIEQTSADRLAAEAKNIKFAPAMMTDNLLRRWNLAFDALWTTSEFTPAEKLAAMGVDAAELFALNQAFTVFLIGQLTGKRDDLVAEIVAKLAAIPPFTANADGTVTLN